MPIDYAKVGRSSVRRRARGMTHSEAVAALEEAELQAHLDRRDEAAADDGHKSDGTPATDTPAAMLAFEAELGLADDARRRATSAVLTDAQTAAMLRAMSDDPGLGTGNGEHGH
ncbi:hypothetical protein AB8O64_36435 (plasmid) [Streptomyces sp. QH1-20]|uniref:hypothetical protein n=1 Tax=Streptomyces sp. QH1-20 TaxID=3240934 RepID=UPI003514CD0D